VYQHQISRENLKVSTPPALRKKFRSRRLTFDDIVDVCHRVIILKEYQHEVAKFYRLTPQAISRYVRKVQKNP
jgi:hypothetical protein